jgi:hypothetical protein
MFNDESDEFCSGEPDFTSDDDYKSFEDREAYEDMRAEEECDDESGAGLAEDELADVGPEDQFLDSMMEDRMSGGEDF